MASLRWFNYGLLHEDLFFETSGEFFGVWEALKPVVPTFRELFVNKQVLVHLEEAAAVTLSPSLRSYDAGLAWCSTEGNHICTSIAVSI